MEPTIDVAGDYLHRLFTDHHRAIQRACRALLIATCADDPRDLVETFRRFERAMLDHFTAERELLLPAYEREAPREAEAIRAEHATLERELLQLGIAVELHAIRAQAIHRLIGELRAHAAHEDVTLYRWADAHLSLSEKQQVSERIGDSRRRLARTERTGPQPDQRGA